MAENATTPAPAQNLTVMQEAVANQNKVRRQRAVAKVEAELAVLGEVNDQRSALDKKAKEIVERIEKIAAEVPVTVEDLIGKKL